ncbi:MAG: hypothetical protein AB8I08_12460 [Sandaracinaceae bacterium]
MAATHYLDVLEIDDPCPLPWSALQGEGRVKHCGTCDKNVYHLSRMTRDEAEALLHQHGDSVCVQFYARRDGTIVTADCKPARLERARQAARRAMVGAGAMMAGLLAFTLGLAALLLGWVSRDAAAPVVSKLQATQKVLQPMMPMPLVPVPEPPQYESARPEPSLPTPPHYNPDHMHAAGGIRMRSDEAPPF